MKIVSRGLRAATLATLGVAAVAPATALAQQPQAADVSVRVEAGSATLVRTTPVTTAPGAFRKSPGAPECSGTSAAGALERAVDGDWGGSHDSFGQRVERIRTVTHGFEEGERYWALYVNDRPSQVGACEAELQTGDEVLFYSACVRATTDCHSGEPLDLDVPRRVAPGQPFTVTVREVTTSYGGPPDFAATTAEPPSRGATVTAAGQTVTTDAQGRATLTAPGNRVDFDVTARKAGRPPETVVACVSDGDDGRCGAPDTDPPKTLITSIREQQAFARGRGPRELRGLAGLARNRDFRTEGLAPDPSGIQAVKLRLSRRDRGRCWGYSGRRERFVRTRCGIRNAWWIRIGDRADWSYLLPARLPRGRYLLDAKAIDGRHNRDEQRRRGENRVEFFVR